jgi:hypothetical protein
MAIAMGAATIVMESSGSTVSILFRPQWVEVSMCWIWVSDRADSCEQATNSRLLCCFHHPPNPVALCQ